MRCAKCYTQESKLRVTPFGDICQICYDKYYWCVEDRRKIRETEKENAELKDRLFKAGICPKCLKGYYFNFENCECDKEQKA